MLLFQAQSLAVIERTHARTHTGTGRDEALAGQQLT